MVIITVTIFILIYMQRPDGGAASTGDRKITTLHRRHDPSAEDENEDVAIERPSEHFSFHFSGLGS
jgi:hypothetical protein